MKIAVASFLVATFVVAAADDDAICTAGQCDVKDEQDFLQSKISLDVLDITSDTVSGGGTDKENDITSDAVSGGGTDMEIPGAFKYLPEKASDPHSNDKGYEVFIKIQDACDKCDVVCEDKQLKAAFVLCDDDKNKKLTVTEIHGCMFDGDAIAAGTKADQTANVNASDAVLTPASATKFIKDHDADGSDDLTEDEFLDARAPPCNGIATLEENATLATTRSVAKCVSKTVEKVSKKITEKCTRTVNAKDCWHSWQWWRGGWWECRWKTFTETYDCVKNKAMDIVKEAGAGFAECYKNVIDEVKKKEGGPFMDLLDECSSPDDCKDKLLDLSKNKKKLLDKIVDEAKSGFLNIANTRLRKGVLMTQNFFEKVPPLASSLKDVAIDVGSATAKMVKGSAKAIREEGDLLNMCTPDGYGYWSFAPTDCGAFGRLKDILKITNIGDIESIFEDAVNKFGQCVRKRSMLSLPTPFLDVNVNSWCVPDLLQKPVRGIVGTFRYVMAQIAAGVNGCSGSSAQQPVCQMVQDIKKIGEKMRTAFSSSLLQQTAEVVGSELHDDKIRYTGGWTPVCAGEDFKVFIELTGAADFGIAPISLSSSFAMGCRKNKLFVDIVFGLGGDLFIAGYNVEPPAKISTGGAVAIGFEEGPLDTPSEDIVKWDGWFKIVGAAGGLGATSEFELGLQVLPSLDYPTGFMAQPEVEVGSLLLQQARQQEIDDAVEKAETIEDKFYNAAGTMFRHMSNLDVTEMFQAAQFMSEMRRGAASIKGQGQAEGWPILKEASLTAGLAVEFCLTCGLNAAEKSAAGAS